MNDPARLNAFNKAVKNKFDVYNSLFLNLPFRKISNIGMLIPLLQHVCQGVLTRDVSRSRFWIPFSRSTPA
jgi:hypothetical protein